MKTNYHTQKLIATLSEKFNRKYVFLVGRATTAIYIALKTIDAKKGNIILPDILCPSPANAVIYGGFDNRFCDVNISDYNMNIDSLNETINNSTQAIIPVHLFGHPVEIDPILEIAEDNNCIVIEDAAQSFGGTYNGKILGSLGDISVLSFGGKIIDGGGGGAILTDSLIHAKKVQKLINFLPNKPTNIQKRYEDYKKYYYSTSRCADQIERKCLFKAMPLLYKDIYLYAFEKEVIEKILMEITFLDDNIIKRKENVKLYRKNLQHPFIRHPHLNKDDVIYRYSILIEEPHCNRVTEEIRKRGYDASNLYYVPLHEIFETNQDIETFKNSNYVSKRILNLWNEPKIKEEYIIGLCNTIIEKLS